MRRVLLTGANGLLGSHIAIELKRKAIEFYAIVRPGKATPLLSALSANIVEGDIRDKQFLEKWVKQSDYIIHAAARTAPYPMDLREFYPINVEATRHLLDLATRYGLKRFVHISTANCFTNGSKQQPGTEKSPFMPWLKDSAYAYSKYLAQKEVLQVSKNQGLAAIVICPTFLIGAHDYKPSSGQLILHGLRRNITFYPPGGKSFVSASAAAVAIVNALEMGREGECYLLAEAHYSYLEFFQMLLRLVNKRSFLVPIPRHLLRLIGRLGTFAEHNFGKSSLLTSANAKMLCLPNYFSGEKAKQELAMPSRAIEEALQEAITWFEQNDYL